MPIKRTLLICIFFFTLAPIRTSAQSDFRNAVFLELGGSGYYYSVNFERSFKRAIHGRVGIHYFQKVVAIPLTVGKVFGSGNHHMEVAGGVDLVQNSYGNTTIRLTVLVAFIGYRFQKPYGRHFLRAGFTPFYDPHEPYLWPWVGVGGGYRFK